MVKTRSFERRGFFVFKLKEKEAAMADDKKKFPYDFDDPDVLKFEFQCPQCGKKHFHELTDEDIDAGNIGPLRLCDECAQNLA